MATKHYDRFDGPDRNFSLVDGWGKVNGAGNGYGITSGIADIRNGSNNEDYYYRFSPRPKTLSQTIEADIAGLTGAVDFRAAGVVVNMGSDNTGYVLRANPNGSNYNMFRHDSGTTTLNVNASVTPAVGQRIRLKVTHAGGQAVFEAYIDQGSGFPETPDATNTDTSPLLNYEWGIYGRSSQASTKYVSLDNFSALDEFEEGPVVDIFPINEKPLMEKQLLRGLLRAFFFDARDGYARDSAQKGETVSIESGITLLSPFGVDIPRTDDVEITVTNDRGHWFEINHQNRDDHFAAFFHFRFDGNITDVDEFTLSSNATGGTNIWSLDASDSTIEDGLEHTILVTSARGKGMHVYLDGNFLASDLTEGSANGTKSHLIRYDASSNLWEIRVADGTGLGDTLIGGTRQKAQDRWDGPIYAALYWNRFLSETEARWLHHSYRKLRTVRKSALAALPKKDQRLVVF